ncbi:predicted protein [Naegleria gruberi]|uniref:Predicted protein n=1 Tax=Naegleria gruberi TaxID=5762 RepID=D2VXZ5_NAEGR|nr:uncharacterized protein NAEGRDRAFT_73914 [Naegleria gruberi]EFC38232.1 predicted protein [Naegleria gruberi]|eukprot:XP_002670976.1 predicted protein [Naegleria gruberi strain NEG-M]
MTSNSGSSTMTMNLGTIFYMAPEIIGSGYEIGSSLDVYSYSMIMYELFFEEKPYSPTYSTKMTKFSPNSSLDSSRDSQQFAFSIPLKVLKCERPNIPWNNSQEFEGWIDEFVKPYQSSSSSGGGLNHSGVCSEYIELMQQCWDQVPSNRPNFKEIGQQLNNMLSSL